MEKELKDYGLHVEWSEAEDREPIDFEIRDDNGVLWATVWGSEPWKDVQIDCDHPAECVEYDDDEPVGHCALCGAECDCHYELDEGNVEDYYWSGRRLVPHEWHMIEKIGGIVGRYLKGLQEKW